MVCTGCDARDDGENRGLGAMDNGGLGFGAVTK
jgi:hypothetical protein